MLQDVSDRIEKEEPSSDILQCLQRSSIAVVRGDWKMHIGAELQEGKRILYFHEDWSYLIGYKKC